MNRVFSSRMSTILIFVIFLLLGVSCSKEDATINNAAEASAWVADWNTKTQQLRSGADACTQEMHNHIHNGAVHKIVMLLTDASSDDIAAFRRVVATSREIVVSCVNAHKGKEWQTLMKNLRDLRTTVG